MTGTDMTVAILAQFKGCMFGDASVLSYGGWGKITI